MTEESMKILVNATSLLGNMTGVGQVSSEMLKRLASYPGLDIDYYTPLKVFYDLGSIEQRSPTSMAVRSIKKIFRKLPFKEVLRRKYVGRGLAEGSYDLYWEPNFIPLKHIRADKIITTVHDMSFYENPEWHPKDRVTFMKANFFENIGRSDVVVTVSEFSKQRLLAAQSEIREERIQVIYNGIDHNLFKRYDEDSVAHFKKLKGLPDSFVLFVGTMEPRKNLQLLLSAYGSLPEHLKEEFPLVLAGDVGWKNNMIFKNMKNQKNHVRWLGYLDSRTDLALLYNAASVFVYPSLYEGFGIPPLESMACGTPVCLSSIPVFREVFGNDSAVYADPVDRESLSEALLALLDGRELRERLSSVGSELSARYTWDETFAKYLALFCET